MKKIVFVICLISSVNCFAQKIPEYKAINGINYKIGDVVTLGEGSSRRGAFLYLQMGGWGAFLSDGTKIGPEHNHTTVTVKKIKMDIVDGVPKIIFSVGVHGATNLSLNIDDAIQACEVVPCAGTNASSVPAVSSVADELIKLKKLLDDGAITQDEFDAQKKKLLGN